MYSVPLYSNPGSATAPVDNSWLHLLIFLDRECESEEAAHRCLDARDVGFRSLAVLCRSRPRKSYELALHSPQQTTMDPSS